MAISGHFVWSEEGGVFVKESKGEPLLVCKFNAIPINIETGECILMDLASVPCASFEQFVVERPDVKSDSFLSAKSRRMRDTRDELRTISDRSFYESDDKIFR